MATIQGDIGTLTPESANPPLTYIEVSRGYENTGTGRVVTLVFRGSKNALRIASAQWVALGARYQIREDGPYSEATVTIGGNNFDPGTAISEQSAPLPNEIAPDIRYEFRTDYVDISIFALPAVAKEAAASGNPAAYRVLLETLVKDKLPLPSGASVIQQRLYQKLSREEESFPVSRISLTRIASFPGNLGLPQIPNGLPPVYRPISFIAAWNLPFSVQQMLPPIPIDPITGQVQAPPGTEWGWKQTNYSTSLVQKTNQVEQVVSWTFAAYDTDIYPFI